MAASQCNPADLSGLIHRQAWDLILRECQENPSAAQKVGRSRRLPLHAACAAGCTPTYIIRALVEAYPAAASMPDNFFGDTPLHLVCRNSQRTYQKAQVLLQFMSEDDVMKKNITGGTALHTACNHNALVGVCRSLVQANPSILLEKSFEGYTALVALWHSYIQSIPGHLAVAKILEGDTEARAGGHFHRFWEKVELIALESFRQSAACPEIVGDAMRDYLAHGLLLCGAPLPLFKVALKLHPALAATVDKDGNTPLHLVVDQRPFRLKELEAIVALLEASPESACVQNRQGQTPLHVAIRNKLAWGEGLGEILCADLTQLCEPEPRTGLYPFLLAASTGGIHAVDTTFQLLCAQPDVMIPTTAL